MTASVSFLSLEWHLAFNIIVKRVCSVLSGEGACQSAAALALRVQSHIVPATSSRPVDSECSCASSTRSTPALERHAGSSRRPTPSTRRTTSRRNGIRQPRRVKMPTPSVLYPILHVAQSCGPTSHHVRLVFEWAPDPDRRLRRS